jgi:hypothetical protein
MDSDAPVKEVLEDLYTLLENMETQNTAILRFLQDQKIASEEKLQPYLEQAGNASSVRWRAARARMEHLFAPAPTKATEAVSAPKASESLQPAAANPTETKTEPRKPDPSNSSQSSQAESVKNQPSQVQQNANQPAPEPHIKNQSRNEDQDKPQGETTPAANADAAKAVAVNSLDRNNNP